MNNNTIYMKKLWFLPPRVLTTDLLLLEFDATHELVYQIEDKYHTSKFSGKSKMIRRFFGYQPYVFLRNKMVSAEISRRTGSQLLNIPKSIVVFGEPYYSPAKSIIQDQCEQIFEYWEDMQNMEKVSELSVLTIPQINEELTHLFAMYKDKYGF